MTINRLSAYFKMKNSGGRIFSALYVKKDGSLRRIVCRLGVRKGLTGTGMRYNAEDKLLMPVYDIQKSDYRMINLDTVQAVTVQGTTYNVEE